MFLQVRHPATVVAMSDKDWSTLAARVQWCIDAHRVKNAAAWSEAAGLARSYVGRIKNEGIVPSGDVIEKMATAAGVSFDWLRHGEGMPSGRVELDDPYPSRAPVIAMAEASGVPHGAIEALKADRFADGDPGEEVWRERLIKHVKWAKVLDRVLRDELPDDDTFGKDDE